MIVLLTGCIRVLGRPLMFSTFTIASRAGVKVWVAVFANYARDIAWVRSDLDLHLGEVNAEGTQYQRLIHWRLEHLLLDC